MGFSPFKSIPNKLQDAETYNWASHRTAWLPAIATDMFTNIPIGSYKLILNFGWDASTVHSSMTINYPGGTHGVAFGAEDGAGASLSNYREYVFYLTSNAIGSWTATATIASGIGGVLRPTATLIRIYARNS